MVLYLTIIRKPRINQKKYIVWTRKIYFSVFLYKNNGEYMKNIYIYIYISAFLILLNGVYADVSN